MAKTRAQAAKAATKETSKQGSPAPKTKRRATGLPIIPKIPGFRVEKRAQLPRLITSNLKPTIKPRRRTFLTSSDGLGSLPFARLNMQDDSTTTEDDLTTTQRGSTATQDVPNPAQDTLDTVKSSANKPKTIRISLPSEQQRAAVRIDTGSGYQAMISIGPSPMDIDSRSFTRSPAPSPEEARNNETNGSKTIRSPSPALIWIEFR